MSPGKNPSFSPASTAGLVRIYALDSLCRKHRKRYGHGQICLTGSGRADPEDYLMLAQSINIGPLRCISWLNMFAGSDDHTGFAKKFLHVCRRIPHKSLVPLQQVFALKLPAAFKKIICLCKQLQQKPAQSGSGGRDRKLRSAMSKMPHRIYRPQVKIGI